MVATVVSDVAVISPLVDTNYALMMQNSWQRFLFIMFLFWLMAAIRAQSVLSRLWVLMRTCIVGAWHKVLLPLCNVEVGL